MSDHFLEAEKIHSVEQGKYIGDFVYGANDGIITTFAVVSGATGATFSAAVILILGIANLVADGISMGLSNYLALRSRRDYQKKQRAIEEREVREIPDKEREEVREILEKRWHVSGAHLDEATRAITNDEKRWVDFMMREELSILEEGVFHPLRHGLATFVAFVVAGAMPLIPYVFGVAPSLQFSVSVIATAVSLFLVGSFRTRVTGAPWFRSGLEMLGVGGLAAGAAYGLGYAVRIWIGVGL